MRRVIGPVLTGLGVFFIVVALLVEFYLPGRAIKFPLNEYSKSTLLAHGANYFSPKQVSELSGVTLQVTNTVKGDVTAAKATGNSNIAVWQSFEAIEDITNHSPVSIPASPNLLAFDRVTGVLLPWSGNSVGGKHITTVSGQGYVWPLGAKKQSYQVFDTTLLKTVTFTYKGTSTTGGVATYVYTANVASQQVGTQSLPGSLVGMSASEVTLPEFYGAQETYYVDPVTGAPLAVNENVQQVLKDSTGATRLVLLSGDFTSTSASISAAVNTDNTSKNVITLATLIVPIVAGVLGVILLVLGLVLSRSRPEDEEYEDADEPVSSPA
jgi:hypothetical protein